jgi:hypothetical protein
MIKNKFSECIFSEIDLLDLLMQDPARSLNGVIVDQSVNLDQLSKILNNPPAIAVYSTDELQPIEQFDKANQQVWHMPTEYQELDIAAFVLGLCDTDAQLQRCGQELILFQERNLFQLLRYLHYLVHVMTENKIIWGVGRGSSVASYVLYLLKVHRVDSLYYNLDPTEFLR